MTQRVRVAPASAFDDGDREFVTVDGVEVGVVRYGGEFYAIANRCCHQAGPVAEGLVRERLVAEWPGPGERETERFGDRPAVSCPMHGWEYDLETGEHLGDGDVAVETFDVTVEDGVVYVLAD